MRVFRCMHADEDRISAMDGCMHVSVCVWHCGCIDLFLNLVKNDICAGSFEAGMPISLLSMHAWARRSCVAAVAIFCLSASNDHHLWRLKKIEGDRIKAGNPSSCCFSEMSVPVALRQLHAHISPADC